MEYRKITQLLKSRRIKLRLTQAQLAEKLGKNQSYVTKYEIGESRLKLADFIKICNVLKISPPIHKE